MDFSKIRNLMNRIPCTNCNGTGINEDAYYGNGICHYCDGEGYLVMKFEKASKQDKALMNESYQWQNQHKAMAHALIGLINNLENGKTFKKGEYPPWLSQALGFAKNVKSSKEETTVKEVTEEEILAAWFDLNTTAKELNRPGEFGIRLQLIGFSESWAFFVEVLKGKSLTTGKAIQLTKNKHDRSHIVNLNLENIANAKAWLLALHKELIDSKN